MAIVKMKKITAAAPQSQRDDILDVLQSNGCVQLIDLKDKLEELDGIGYFKESKSVSQTEINYNRIKFTYEFLKQYNTQKGGLFAKREVISKEEFDSLESVINWESIYMECKEIEDAINLNKNKKGKVISLIEQYGQWTELDVSDKELHALKNVSYFIGTVAKKYESQLFEELNKDFNSVYIEKISEKQQDMNVFILCHKSESHNVFESLKKYGFTKVSLDLSDTPKDQIRNLNKQSEELDIELKTLKEKAENVSKNIKNIEKIYDYVSNKLEVERAVSKLAKTEKTFILQGWMPESSEGTIINVIEKNFKDAFVTVEEASEDDVPPVALKNNKLAEPFEVITSMYALPLPTEVDPTPVLAPFYLLFFGMMAGDIGYGIVMFLVTFFALKYIDLGNEANKIVRLLMYCSIPTIFFGWVFGGFFGDAIKITPLWVNPVDKPMSVLYLSVAIGIVHLFTGLGVKAYMLIRDGKILDAIYDVFFWYALLSGLIWLLLGGGAIPKYIAIVGAVGLLLTQGRGNATIVGKFFGGVYGLYGVTSYIGDVLSYSRLLALGLATGLIGSSFNLLIHLLGKGAFAVIFGIVIFLAGHTFNFLIGMLGTFVHTCRLEYLEFFGKFYEGGGKAFNPLRISTKFIKVNTER